MKVRWLFELEGNLHNVEIEHSDLSGRKIVVLDGNAIHDTGPVLCVVCRSPGVVDGCMCNDRVHTQALLERGFQHRFTIGAHIAVSLARITAAVTPSFIWRFFLEGFPPTFVSVDHHVCPQVVKVHAKLATHEYLCELDGQVLPSTPTSQRSKLFADANRAVAETLGASVRAIIGVDCASDLVATFGKDMAGLDADMVDILGTSVEQLDLLLHRLVPECVARASLLPLVAEEMEQGSKELQIDAIPSSIEAHAQLCEMDWSKRLEAEQKRSREHTARVAKDYW